MTYGVQGQGTQTMTVSGGDTTMTTIEGVMSSTTYSIEVAAVNSVDTGPYSEAVIIDIPQSKWGWNSDHNYYILILIDMFIIIPYVSRCISQSEW